MRAIASESGTSRLAVRVRPTSDPNQLVVAYPWRHRGRAEALGHAVAHALDALPTPDVEGAVQCGGRAGRLRGAGRATDHDHSQGPRGRGDRHQRQDHDEPDDRPHRAGRRQAGRLVQHRRHLHRRRARRGGGLLRSERSRARPRTPAGAARRHRDRPGRHPAQGHRPDPQRRLGRHQRHRRPPRPPGHRHGRPAGRGQVGRAADHPQGGLGRPQRRRSPRAGNAVDHQGPAVGVLAGPRLARDPRHHEHGWPRDVGHRRLDHRAPPRCRPARPWSSWSTYP